MRKKVVVAGMGSRLEAAVAPKGYLCGKTTVLIQNKEDICPYALCAFLNSSTCISIYEALFSMRGISGKAMNIGPRQIERLPSPPTQYLKAFFDKDTLGEEEQLSFLGQYMHRTLSEKKRHLYQKKIDRFVEKIVLSSIIDG